MQAIILAGGLGTRIRATIGDKPKVMAPIDGRPFIELLLDRLAQRGVSSIIMAIGNRADVVVGHLGNNHRGLPIVYSNEERPLGTGGATKLALGRAAPGLCFVLNGDSYSDVDLAAMQQAHEVAQVLVSIAVVRLKDVGRFGALNIRDDRITSFREKAEAGPGDINAGVYLMSTDIIERMPAQEAFSLESDFFQENIDDLQPLAFAAGETFIDIGIPADYQRAQTFFKDKVS